MLSKMQGKKGSRKTRRKKTIRRNTRGRISKTMQGN